MKEKRANKRSLRNGQETSHYARERNEALNRWRKFEEDMKEEDEMAGQDLKEEKKKKKQERVKKVNKIKKEKEVKNKGSSSTGFLSEETAENEEKDNKEEHAKKEEKIKQEEDTKTDVEIKKEKEMIRRRAIQRRRSMRRGSRRRRRQAAAKRRAHSRKKRQFRQKSEHSQPAEKDNIEKPYPLSAIKEVPVCIDEGGALDGHSGKDDSGNSKDQHAALVQPDRPWNSSCDEQRRGKSEEILLVRGGVESNPGPKNLAEKMGWKDRHCVGFSQGEGAPNDKWYFTMKQQQASGGAEAKEAQKQRRVKAKENNLAASFQTPPAMPEVLPCLSEEAEEKSNNQEEEYSGWQPDSPWTEDTGYGLVFDFLKMWEQEKQEKIRKDTKKKKAEEKKRQDIAVEKRRREEGEKKLASEKGRGEMEDLSKEEQEEKGRKMKDHPPTPRQAEHTHQPIPQVNVSIYIICYYFYLTGKSHEKGSQTFQKRI